MSLETKRGAKPPGPRQRARLKQDLDDFVDLMDQRVFEGDGPADQADEEPISGSNDN